MAETITISSSSESEDAHAPTNISDSDSDSDFDWDLDEYRAFELSQNQVASESRVLPSWASNGASASSVNERLPSQQDTKRALPNSMQPSFPRVENISSSKVQDSHGKYYDHALPNNASSQNYMNDPFGRGVNNSFSMPENAKSRMLPPTLMHGKSSSTSQFGGYVDPLRAAFGDERATTGDERLIYQAAVQNLNQHRGEATLQEGLLSVPLLRHQKIALNWMLQKETRMQTCLGGILADDQGLGKTVSTIALIQIQKSLQSTSKQESENSKKTEALNLDDDEENVKATPENNKKVEALNLDDDEENATYVPGKGKQTAGSSNSKLVPEFRKRRPAAGTLVVCPASILRQWAREMDEKVTSEAKLSVLVYHGSGRTKNPEELAKYDVVLTTYAIVANEVPKQPLVDEDDDDQKNAERYGMSPVLIANKKRKQPAVDGKKGKRGKKGINSAAFDAGSGPIAKVNWQRVVLDEAQTIKNHRTQVARACCGLRAKTRWCLSGTPIQNAIDELYSYFRFLKYDPYADYKSFCLSIKFPIARNSDLGYRKLQVVLRNIMLRRTKATLIDGKPIISLPPKTIQMTRVDFSGEERAFYLKLETDSRSKFKAYAAAGTVSQNYANILLMLLRLRQACDHPLLAKGSVSYHVGIDSSEKAKKLPRELLISLYKHFEKSLAICPLCIDPPEDAVVTVCGHIFCYQCVSEYLTGDDNTCPSPRCKKQLSTDRVFSKATLINCISENPESDSVNKPHFRETANVMQNDFSSAKIKAVLDILRSRHNSERSCSEIIDDSSVEIQYLGSSSSDAGRPIKTIVFSQWTSMLDLVGHALHQSDIQFRRLDGSMSLVSRDRAVKDFNTDPEITVMLMSLKAGNLGLNMVAACQVILLDLWWNPATEDQAIDRAHRIGQTRPVTVFRLTIKDTVEDRILSLQDEKRKMVASAFGEDQVGASATRLTVEDLNYLFLGRT